jgi:hypothetical protein
LSRHFHAALVVAIAFAAPGCCALAQMVCAFPVPKSPPKGNRDTPEAAVAYLVDAFRDRRTNDIYGSFHPEFTAENGAFSASDFSAAYFHYEADFAADAETMAAAECRVPQTAGNTVVVELVDEKSGAYLPITFENRPRIQIVTTNQFVGTIEGAVDMRALVRLENGRLTLPQNFPLTSIENVSPEAAKALKSSDIVRVEISDDWLVRAIDARRSKNIKFVDKIKEHLPQ